MSDRILQSIVESLTHYQPNLDLIVENRLEGLPLHDLAIREKADIIIFELKDTEIPEICDDMLTDLPDAVLLGVISNGQRIIQYAMLSENMDSEEFINSIIVAKKRFLESIA